MHDITVRVFEHLDITSAMDVYVSIKYTERILREPVLNKYQLVLEEYKESEKVLSEYQWSLRFTKGFSMEQLCTWANVCAIYGSGDPISGSDWYN